MMVLLYHRKVIRKKRMIVGRKLLTMAEKTEGTGEGVKDSRKPEYSQDWCRVYIEDVVYRERVGLRL